MPTTINELTDEQTAQFGEFRDKWIANGLDTSPANFSLAGDGLNGCYGAAKLASPEIVLTFASPLATVIGGCMGNIAFPMTRGLAAGTDMTTAAEKQDTNSRESPPELKSPPHARRSPTGSEVHPGDKALATSQEYMDMDDPGEYEVRHAVLDSFKSESDFNLITDIWNETSNQLRAQTGVDAAHPAFRRLSGGINAEVWKTTKDRISDEWRQYRGGNLWSSWYAYVTYFRDACNWENPALESFAHDEKCATNAGWIWYSRKVAAISDRPNILLRNEDGELHCEDGPAMAWRDGWALWRFNGVEVDEQIIMTPETQTVEQMHADDNADRQSIRIERYGWAQYLKDSGAKEVDKATDDVSGCPQVLYRTHNGGQRLVVVCQTGRVFAMGVPSDVETCEQAQKWLAPEGINIIAAT